MKRTLVAWVVFLAASMAFSQGAVYDSIRPEANIVIKRHNMGADLVEITVLSKDYPADALRAKIAALGKYLSVEPRGLAVNTVVLDPTSKAGAFLKASFGIDGLIRQAEPRLNLKPILQAFGTGDQPLKKLSVQFAGVVPSNDTFARFLPEDGSVRIEAIATQTPPGIDYHVEVATDDPEKIILPGLQSESQKVREATKISSGPPVGAIVGFAVGGLGLGLLVYSLALRGRGTKGR